MQSYQEKLRTLSGEAGLMNPVPRRGWSALGIGGRPARFRGEPAPRSA